MTNMRTTAILPRGDENGLAPIAHELANQATGRQPKQLYAVVAIVDCARIAVDTDTGTEVVTPRFRRVELLLAGDLSAAEKLIRRSLEHRSGRTTLPLDLEDEIRQAFTGISLYAPIPGEDDEDQDHADGACDKADDDEEDTGDE